MAASQSTTGFGAEFGIKSGSNFAFLAEVKSISGLGMTREMRDVTHLKSPTRYREKKPGLRDGKGAVIRFAYVPGGADETALLAAINSDVVGTFAVKFPGGAIWSFDGFATDFEVGEINAEGEMEATATFAQTGAVTRS
jgi:hypothetical protein